ncbi:MAG: hypothetical protein F6J97_12575, partial [Leptolyngbya sp. SIO4C1]|nr:hypothetical protein [Leptolyngbya sp. SIO4C1]
MDSDDVLILTIYFLVVIYVLYQMALSLEAQQEDQIELLLDAEKLEKNVRAQLSYRSYASQIQAKVEDSKLAELLKEFEEATGHKVEEDKKKPSYKRLVLSIETRFEQLASEEQTSDRSPQENQVSIAVLPQGKKPLEPSVRFLNVNIYNQTADYQVFIDWDRCSITYLNKEGQRVIRVLPDESFDLFQPQVYSVINPGQ